MYQLEICIVILGVIAIMAAIGLYISKQQLDLMMQGKNKPKRIYADEYYYMLRNRFPKAKELYEQMIVDEIGNDGLVSLVSVKKLKLKENIYGEPIYEFYFER